MNNSEAKDFMSRMEDEASQIPEIELNPKNWLEQFGEDGMISSPIGQVKMGDNQIAKLFENDRSKQFGMIKPTLETPQCIIEVQSEAKDGNVERYSSLLFVKTFIGKDGKKVYYFKSVTVKKDGLEVSISSHYDRTKRIKEALKKGKLLYRFDGGAQTEHLPADVSVTTSPENKQGFSTDKDTKKSINTNELDKKVSQSGGEPEVKEKQTIEQLITTARGDESLPEAIQARGELSQIGIDWNEKGTIEDANANRMKAIEQRLADIDDRKIELGDIRDGFGSNPDPMEVATIDSELFNLDKEQRDLEAEYSGLKALQEESNIQYDKKEESPTSTETHKEIGNKIVGMIKDAGIEVSTDQKEMQDILDEESSNIRKLVVEDTNERFDRELQQQIDGSLPLNHIYKIGSPSAILLSAGIPDLPIELASSRLSNKSMQDNHPFALDEVKGLVNAVQQPLAVFRSATHIGSNVILTELKHGKKSFVVAIQTNRSKDKILINDIRSVHYRNSDMNIVGWINDGLADYVKPTFESDWLDPMKNELLSKPQYNSAEVRSNSFPLQI